MVGRGDDWQTMALAVKGAQYTAWGQMLAVVMLVVTGRTAHAPCAARGPMSFEPERRVSSTRPGGGRSPTPSITGAHSLSHR